MIDFLLVLVPDENYLQRLGVRARYNQGVQLVGQQAPPAFNLLDPLLRRDPAHIELVWPKFNTTNGGILFLYAGEEPGQLRVSSNANALTVANTANSDLLFFLGKPPANTSLLIKQGNAARRFERSQADLGWFPDPHGEWIRRCSLFTKSFSSVGGPAQAGFAQLTLGVDNKAAIDPPLAVLNPLVFRISLEGNELAPIQPQGNNVTFETVLLNLIAASRQQGGFFHVEPIIPAEADLRILGLDAVAEKARTRKTRSVIEELLLAPRCVPEWLPFLCLDLLPGRFRLNHPELDHSEAGKWKSWGFLPSETPPANAVWFAKHWVNHWGGRYDQNIADEEVVKLPERECDPSAREQFIEMGQRALETREDYDTAFADFDNFLDQLARLKLEREADGLSHLAHDPFLDWVRQFRGRLPRNIHQPFVTRAIGREAQVVSWKQDGLVQALAATLLFPASPVLVQPPPAAAIPDPARRDRYTAVLGDRWFNLRSSVRWFSRDFGQRVAAADSGTQDAIPWEDNWWGDWYDRLFRPGAGPRFTFRVEYSGFVIGKSSLGDVLGAGAGSEYEQGDLIVI